MPDESKARLFELEAVRPPFETALFALAWFVLATGTVFALAHDSLLVASGLAVFWLLGGIFFQRSVARNPSILKMGLDGFTVTCRSSERFVPWAGFIRFEDTSRGVVALTNDSWIPLGRPHVWDGVGRRQKHKVLMSLKQLEEAAKHWRQQRSKPRIILQLLKAHDEKQWPTILEKAAQSDFRTSGITQTHLRDDLLNPDTPPALRELLAKTLQIRVDESAIEDTIETFASERSKKALRSLLADAD